VETKKRNKNAPYRFENKMTDRLLPRSEAPLNKVHLAAAALLFSTPLRYGVAQSSAPD